MPTKVSNFGLLILLICCAVCSYAQVLPPLNLIPPIISDHINGVYIVPIPVLITPHPGKAYFTIESGYSINLCISPYAPVSFNLSGANCGWDNFLQFNYTQSPNAIALFLEDFNMNFRGLGTEVAPESVQPWRPIIQNATLLQQVPYFISLAFQVQPKNSTETAFNLYVTAENRNCTPNQLPTEANCQNLSAQLTPTNYSTIPVNPTTPVYFSFVVNVPLQILAQSVEITLFSQTESVDQIQILIAFGQQPTTLNYQYNISTGNAPPPSSFLIANSYSKNLTNPLSGTYYAMVTTTAAVPRNINIQYTVSNCSVEETTTDACANTTILGSTETTSIQFNGQYNYFAVSDAPLSLGVKAQSSSIFINMYIGVNYFPDAATLATGIGWFQNSTNGVLYFSLNASRTYVISIQGPPGQSGIIWQGSQCPYKCNDNGSCNDQLQCECDDDYSGEYCSDKSSSKKLSTLYIVLIIIGGAVVLAILIGVPVALYLNNRKRARYERV